MLRVAETPRRGRLYTWCPFVILRGRFFRDTDIPNPLPRLLHQPRVGAVDVDTIAHLGFLHPSFPTGNHIDMMALINPMPRQPLPAKTARVDHGFVEVGDEENAHC